MADKTKSEKKSGGKTALQTSAKQLTAAMNMSLTKGVNKQCKIVFEIRPGEDPFEPTCKEALVRLQEKCNDGKLNLYDMSTGKGATVAEVGQNLSTLARLETGCPEWIRQINKQAFEEVELKPWREYLGLQEVANAFRTSGRKVGLKANKDGRGSSAGKSDGDKSVVSGGENLTPDKKLTEVGKGKGGKGKATTKMGGKGQATTSTMINNMREGDNIINEQGAEMELNMDGKKVKDTWSKASESKKVKEAARRRERLYNKAEIFSLHGSPLVKEYDNCLIVGPTTLPQLSSHDRIHDAGFYQLYNRVSSNVAIKKRIMEVQNIEGRGKGVFQTTKTFNPRKPKTRDEIAQQIAGAEKEIIDKDDNGNFVSLGRYGGSFNSFRGDPTSPMVSDRGDDMEPREKKFLTLEDRVEQQMFEGKVLKSMGSRQLLSEIGDDTPKMAGGSVFGVPSSGAVSGLQSPAASVGGSRERRRKVLREVPFDQQVLNGGYHFRNDIWIGASYDRRNTIEYRQMAQEARETNMTIFENDIMRI